MTSPQPETETYEVTLSNDEQWVVHALLANEIDDAIDENQTPPAWALELFDALEADDGTTVLTGYQAQRLVETMTAYVDAGATPEEDIVHGSAVAERLEDRLESRESVQ
ncbi:DUF7853 family protein [Natronorubrum tibetense]|uniref:Uncharacterized protein n=1 Tax=Natronorubrum tibetense GA33 TaxID=1114856 RepID=L9W0U7_9EURY|nr:hypothetical protein [Natronorubrum tibetense]ELY42926.1 hypothetical protein C496_06317 [Natronorubrum tibetense GA33]